MDVADRVPQLGPQAIALKALMREKRVDHKRYIQTYGDDSPDIRDWQWPG
jgi:xylulose-5-phosphate/fructose-6-phosphate phosphoketolase